MEDIHFLKMTEADLSKVLDIYNGYVLNSTATFHTQALSTEEMREIVFFAEDRYGTFLIKRGEEICGYVLLCPFKKREAYNRTAEVTVYLKENLVGRGIGSLAIDYIEAFAKVKGIQELIAIICGENTSSIKTFEKKGYIQCAHYYRVGCKFGRLLDVVSYQKHL